MLNVYRKNVDHVLKNDEKIWSYIKMLIFLFENINQAFQKKGLKCIEKMLTMYSKDDILVLNFFNQAFKNV